MGRVGGGGCGHDLEKRFSLRLMMFLRLFKSIGSTAYVT